MARFHDHGGWQIPALRHISLPALTGALGARSASPGRFWVAISDQPGNCWDPSASQAATPLSSARAPSAAGQNDRDLLLQCSDDMSQHSPEPNRPPLR